MHNPKCFLSNQAVDCLRRGALVALLAMQWGAQWLRSQETMEHEAGALLCEQRLRLVGQALEAFHMLNGEESYPDSLKQLVVEGFLGEPHRFCPLGESGHQRSNIVAEDQESETAYHYEFSGQPSMTAESKGLFARGRDLKLAQKELLGDLGWRVPVVRCLNHGSDLLNLANAGAVAERVYRSPLYWESRPEFIERMPLLYLLGTEAFYDGRPIRDRLTPRRATLDDTRIDLADVYNSHLKRFLVLPQDSGRPDRDFSGPIGTALMDSGLGEVFDCRGAIVVEGKPGHFWQSLDRDAEGREITESFRIAPESRVVPIQRSGARLKILVATQALARTLDIDPHPIVVTIEVGRGAGMPPILVPLNYGEHVGPWRRGSAPWDEGEASAAQIPLTHGDVSYALYAFEAPLDAEPLAVDTLKIQANPEVEALTMFFALTLE